MIVIDRGPVGMMAGVLLGWVLLVVQPSPRRCETPKPCALCVSQVLCDHCRVGVAVVGLATPPELHKPGAAAEDHSNSLNGVCLPAPTSRRPTPGTSNDTGPPKPLHGILRSFQDCPAQIPRDPIALFPGLQKHEVELFPNYVAPFSRFAFGVWPTSMFVRVLCDIVPRNSMDPVPVCRNGGCRRSIGSRPGGGSTPLCPSQVCSVVWVRLWSPKCTMVRPHGE